MQTRKKQKITSESKISFRDIEELVTSIEEKESRYFLESVNKFFIMLHAKKDDPETVKQAMVRPDSSH